MRREVKRQMDKKIQKMPLVGDEDENSESGWFKQNRSMIIAIVIIIILIGGIYALSKKETKQEIAEEAQEVATEEEEAEETLEAETAGKQEEVVEEGEVQADKIVEYAERGEGVTHLARKALNRYLDEVESDIALNNEQKIYIEDYLQNRTGSKGLKIGESMSFSKELIKEAIKASEGLTPAQIENLKKYSRIVYPSEA